MGATESTLDARALRAPAAEVDGYLRAFLARRPLPRLLAEAIEYVYAGGGKRLRPLLALRCCEAAGRPRAEALAPAAAIELVHAFSLVHDDLPAMDDDDLRRGRPTLHVHAGEATAILTGDAMMGLAFELLAREAPTPELAGRLCGELAQATNDMIAGQVWDTLEDPRETLDPAARLERLHRHKTGALIRCACRMGALAGGAGPTELELLTRYGEAMGAMFQVTDDVLDETQTTEHLGKTAGKDREQGKLTWPAVHGLERSRAEIQRLADEALSALESLGEPAEPLRELCRWTAVRTR